MRLVLLFSHFPDCAPILYTGTHLLLFCHGGNRLWDNLINNTVIYDPTTNTRHPLKPLLKNTLNIVNDTLRLAKILSVHLMQIAYAFCRIRVCVPVSKLYRYSSGFGFSHKNPAQYWPRLPFLSYNALYCAPSLVFDLQHGFCQIDPTRNTRKSGRRHHYNIDGQIPNILPNFFYRRHHAKRVSGDIARQPFPCSSLFSELVQSVPIGHKSPTPIRHACLSRLQLPKSRWRVAPKAPQPVKMYQTLLPRAYISCTTNGEAFLASALSSVKYALDIAYSDSACTAVVRHVGVVIDAPCSNGVKYSIATDGAFATNVYTNRDTCTGTSMVQSVSTADFNKCRAYGAGYAKLTIVTPAVTTTPNTPNAATGSSSWQNALIAVGSLKLGSRRKRIKYLRNLFSQLIC